MTQKISLPFAVAPELMASYQTVEKDVLSNSDEISRLSAKIESLTASIGVLDRAVAHASQVKANILAAHAVDNATANELDAARTSYETAVKAYEETQELLSAVKKAHASATAKVISLNERKNQAERLIWRDIHSRLILEIQSTSGHLYQMAAAAAQKLGYTQMNPFGGAPSINFVDLSRQLSVQIFG